MRDESVRLIAHAVGQAASRWGLEVRRPERSGPVLPLLRDDWHLYAELSHPLVPPLPVQMSITLEADAARMLCFPSPPVITADTLTAFLQFSNEANTWLSGSSALGRFWVDCERGDLAYELILEEAFLSAHTAFTQLFEVPLSHFTDLHIPVAMLSAGAWGADTAISWLRELRKTGRVDNADYGLY